MTADELRLPAKGGLTQFAGAAGPQARASWTLLLPQPRMLRPCCTYVCTYSLITGPCCCSGSSRNCCA